MRRRYLTPIPIEPSISVDEFCEVENISRSAYYSMKRRGEGPDETHVGNRRTISPEAHRLWRKRRRRPAGAGLHPPAPSRSLPPEKQQRRELSPRRCSELSMSPPGKQ
jgi:hypothetical protein